MRILSVRNFYQHPGGEDVVFKQERELLTEPGDSALHHVRDKGGIARKAPPR